jgi:hypothetical protein
MKKVLLLSALMTIAPVVMAAKTYQVTGPVVEVTDTRIVVEKGREKWEIARDANTKVMGDVKVGEKVTVEYTMTATTITAKPAKGGRRGEAAPATSPSTAPAAAPAAK